MEEDCSHDDLLFVSLSPAHFRARLHWARAHRSWKPQQWDRVLFTDESRFNIQNDSLKAMIWREPGTRYRAPNIVERDHYKGSGLLVWTAEPTSTCSLGVPSQLFDIATKSYTL
ncbi:hypothetical protein AVEN_256278-1 [Araneus ventricosus]|uniref:Transposable element Tc1 transposase n=1 Tax=Araneus ventricosus TaxID=182803 RepID=A0A4Y2U5R3_ARAVE|nr:hypothetical protein AVEN_256278-1 [Araneus ventricosus]